MKNKWHVGFGKAAEIFGPETYRHWEDGFIYSDWPEGWVVVIYNDYGHEYTHTHRFETEAQVESFSEKVKLAFLAGRQPNLDHWCGPRIQYGSQAYIDDEPYIVAREKQDTEDY